MDQARLQFARKMYIQSLPEQDRNLFLYVDKLEAELEDEADTEQHYLKLLKQHTPVIQAANALNMNPTTAYETVQRIEANLTDQLPILLEKTKLIDYTDMLKLKGLCPPEDEKKYYLLNGL
jgi:hypothetical protein